MTGRQQPCVRILAISTSTAPERSTGAACALTLEIDGIVRIDGVELHRDASTGRSFLRFPAWIDAFGQRQSIVRPTTREVRAAILQQVLAALDAGFPIPNHKESP